MDADCGAVGLSFAVHNDICLPYLAELTTPEQQKRWLPGFVSGELIAAIGMTEPGAGSDLAGIRTSAVDAGDHFVVNGAKTFITNGQNADLVITAVRTSSDRHRGLTLMVHRTRPARIRARPQPREARAALPGHVGVGRSPMSTCPRSTCSAR